MTGSNSRSLGYNSRLAADAVAVDKTGGRNEVVEAEAEACLGGGEEEEVVARVLIATLAVETTMDLPL